MFGDWARDVEGWGAVLAHGSRSDGDSRVRAACHGGSRPALQPIAFVGRVLTRLTGSPGAVERHQAAVGIVAQAAEHGGHAAQGGLRAGTAGFAQGDELRRDFDDEDVGRLELRLGHGGTPFARQPRWPPLANATRIARRRVKVCAATRPDLDAPSTVRRWDDNGGPISFRELRTSSKEQAALQACQSLLWSRATR